MDDAPPFGMSKNQLLYAMLGGEVTVWEFLLRFAALLPVGLLVLAIAYVGYRVGRASRQEHVDLLRETIDYERRPPKRD